MKITNKKFSVLFCLIAETYGFETVKRFENFLNNVKSPHVKLYFGDTYVRVSKLLKEIEEFKTETK